MQETRSASSRFWYGVEARPATSVLRGDDPRGEHFRNASGVEFQFITLPKGDKGDQGIQGVKGDTGNTGPTGAKGNRKYRWG